MVTIVFDVVQIGFFTLKVRVLDIGILVVFHCLDVLSGTTVSCGSREASTFQCRRSDRLSPPLSGSSCPCYAMDIVFSSLFARLSSSTWMWQWCHGWWKKKCFHARVVISFLLFRLHVSRKLSWRVS